MTLEKEIKQVLGKVKKKQGVSTDKYYEVVQRIIVDNDKCNGKSSETMEEIEKILDESGLEYSVDPDFPFMTYSIRYQKVAGEVEFGIFYYIYSKISYLFWKIKSYFETKVLKNKKKDEDPLEKYMKLDLN